MSLPREPESETPLTALVASAAALARGANLDSRLAAIVDAAIRATGGVSGVVAAQDPDRPTLEIVTALGVDPAAVASLQAAIADTGHPIARAAAERLATWDRPDEGTGLVHADLPLVTAREGIEQPVGVLSIARPAGSGLSDDARAVLAATADLVAVAVDHARLASGVVERAEWFERMAHSDPLTGLANARTLHRVLELEIARASRQGSEVSVAVFDVDDFSATNEAGGTPVGDTMLREVAAVLAESVRLVDTVARWGGDEFVLVAPGSAGLTVARRVQEGIARLPEVEGHRISVSVGIARFPADGTDSETLLDAAEAATARAKAEGRGTISEAASATS